MRANQARCHVSNARIDACRQVGGQQQSGRETGKWLRMLRHPPALQGRARRRCVRHFTRFHLSKYMWLSVPLVGWVGNVVLLAYRGRAALHRFVPAGRPWASLGRLGKAWEVHTFPSAPCDRRTASGAAPPRRSPLLASSLTFSGRRASKCVTYSSSTAMSPCVTVSRGASRRPVQRWSRRSRRPYGALLFAYAQGDFERESPPGKREPGGDRQVTVAEWR